MDIGCGIGILSMSAARVGAKRVFAIDDSNYVNYTRQIVNDNQFSEVITVLQGKVEEIKLKDYCLFSKTMLSSLIFARDKWLKPYGYILPDCLRIYITAVQDNQYDGTKNSWWDDVYGFNVRAIRQDAVRRPLVDSVALESQVTDAFLIKQLNLYVVERSDLKFIRNFSLNARQNGNFCALATYFEVDFYKLQCVGFTTAPQAPITYWKQTMFLLYEYTFVNEGDHILGTFVRGDTSETANDAKITILVNVNESLSYPHYVVYPMH
ncbi:hypothetical protein FQA39_LY11367 [Lamprigera yunnana]|nr:hypothetical protein FQA39_LY11367 [Lamprigera yunnana]